MKRRYGNEAIAYWSTIGTQAISLDQSKLTCRTALEGCCVGMSLTFISDYLKQIRAGKTPMEAVKSVASLYVQGAPDQAQLAQIFYSALDDSLVLQPMMRDLKARVDGFFSREGLSRREAENFERELVVARRSCQTEVDFQVESLVAAKMGLLPPAELTATCLIEEAERQNEVKPEFQNFIDQLPLGAYAVNLRFEQEGHHIAFIKTRDKCFIYDPNFATFSFTKEEAAKELWKAAKEFYLLNDLCSMTFSSMTLR